MKCANCLQETDTLCVSPHPKSILKVYGAGIWDEHLFVKGKERELVCEGCYNAIQKIVWY